MIGLIALLAGLAALGVAGAAATRDWRRRRATEAVLARRLDGLKSEPDAEADATPGFVQALVDRSPAALRIWIARAGGPPPIRRAAAFTAIAAAAVALTAQIFGMGPALLLFATVIAAPLTLLQIVASRRANAFVDALPHFLDGVRQLLVTGQSFQTAFLQASEDAAPAIRLYLEPAARRVRNGGHVADALALAADRVAIPELHMLAASVRLNLRFGGALGPVLGELASTLRNRARIMREVAAATAETRTSAAILGALPLAGIGLLLVVQPAYVRFLWETDTGRQMLFVAATLQAIGMVVLRRLMRVEF